MGAFSMAAGRAAILPGKYIGIAAYFKYIEIRRKNTL